MSIQFGPGMRGTQNHTPWVGVAQLVQASGDHQTYVALFTWFKDTSMPEN